MSISGFGKGECGMSDTESTVKQQKASVQTDKEPKKKTNWILWIASMALVISIAITIVNQNVKIRNAQAELEELNGIISLQEMKIDELKEVADAVEKENFDKYSDYIEKKARVYGFTKDGEVVFINIAGD